MAYVKICFRICTCRDPGSSVDIVTSYVLTYGFLFLKKTREYLLFHGVQTCFGVHPASCPMDTRSDLLRGKAAGT